MKTLWLRRCDELHRLCLISVCIRCQPLVKLLKICLQEIVFSKSRQRLWKSWDVVVPISSFLSCPHFKNTHCVISLTVLTSFFWAQRQNHYCVITNWGELLLLFLEPQCSAVWRRKEKHGQKQKRVSFRNLWGITGEGKLQLCSSQNMQSQHHSGLWRLGIWICTVFNSESYILLVLDFILDLAFAHINTYKGRN